MKIRPSRTAIKNVLSDKYFANFLDRFFDGDIDPYKPLNWGINPGWGFDEYKFIMNWNGAQKIKEFKDSGSFVLNLTQKDADKFRIVMINKQHAKILQWILDLVGTNNYKELDSFDPYGYDAFNEYITINGKSN